MSPLRGKKTQKSPLSSRNMGTVLCAWCFVLFCSLAVLHPRMATLWTYFLHLSLSFEVLIDSSTGSPFYVLMLSVEAVRVLPRLRAPGIVPCIISFSMQLPCFLMVWPWYADVLALTVSNSSLFTPAFLRTHSFVFFAVHETRRIFLSPFISKASTQNVFLHSSWVCSFQVRRPCSFDYRRHWKFERKHVFICKNL